MNKPTNQPDDPLDALFAQARENRPDTSRAEFGFETRLMARVRAKRQPTGSVWAMVSWRMIPFFAACVVALAVWQAEVASDANDTITMARLNNPVTSDLWDNL